MRQYSLSRSAAAGLAGLVCAAALSSCSPSVSDIDISSAKSRAASKADEASRTEAEWKSLNAEIKTLTGFTGAEQEARMKKTDELREEMARIEALKTEIEAKAAGFEERAKTVRASLAAGTGTP